MSEITSFLMFALDLGNDIMGLKMIYYTVHAKARMIFRGITEEMVKSALLKPDKIGTGYDGKSLVFKKFSKGIVKIVFKKKRSSVIIVSVIWD